MAGPSKGDLEAENARLAGEVDRLTAELASRDERLKSLEVLVERLQRVAARLTRTGRRTNLRLDRTWTWARTLALGFTRLRAAFT